MALPPERPDGAAVSASLRRDIDTTADFAGVCQGGMSEQILRAATSLEGQL